MESNCCFRLRISSWGVVQGYSGVNDVIVDLADSPGDLIRLDAPGL
jgi:hypothetical protein